LRALSWLLAKGAIWKRLPVLKIPAVDFPQSADALSQRQFDRQSIRSLIVTFSCGLSYSSPQMFTPTSLSAGVGMGLILAASVASAPACHLHGVQPVQSTVIKHDERAPGSFCREPWRDECSHTSYNALLSRFYH
jgi:hypothetical protein